MKKSVSLSAIGKESTFTYDIKTLYKKKEKNKTKLFYPKNSRNTTITSSFSNNQLKNNKNEYKHMNNVPPLFRVLSKNLNTKKKFHNNSFSGKNVSIISNIDNNLQLNLSGKIEKIDNFSNLNFKKYILLVLEKEKILNENIKKKNIKNSNVIFKNAFSQTHLNVDKSENNYSLKLKEIDKKIEKIFYEFPQVIQKEIIKMKELKIHVRFCQDMINSIMKNFDIREGNNLPIINELNNTESKLYSNLLNYLDEYNKKNKNLIDYDIILQNDFDLEKYYSKENNFPPTNYDEELKKLRKLNKIASENELINIRKKYKLINNVINESIKNDRFKNKSEPESIIKKYINDSNGFIQKVFNSNKYKEKLQQFKISSSTRFPKIKKKKYFSYTYREVIDNSNEDNYLKQKEEKEKFNIREIFKKKNFEEEEKKKKEIKKRNIEYEIPNYKESTKSVISEYINKKTEYDISNKTNKKLTSSKSIRKRNINTKIKKENKQNENIHNLNKEIENSIKINTNKIINLKNETKENSKKEENKEEKSEKNNEINENKSKELKKIIQTKLKRISILDKKDNEKKVPIHIDSEILDSNKKDTREKIENEIKARKLQNELNYFVNQEENYFEKESDKMFFEDFKEKITSLEKLSKDEYVKYLLNNYNEIYEELNYVKEAKLKAKEINSFVNQLNFGRKLLNNKHNSISKIIDGNNEFINMFKFYH